MKHCAWTKDNIRTNVKHIIRFVNISHMRYYYTVLVSTVYYADKAIKNILNTWHVYVGRYKHMYDCIKQTNHSGFLQTINQSICVGCLRWNQTNRPRIWRMQKTNRLGLWRHPCNSKNMNRYEWSIPEKRKT